MKLKTGFTLIEVMIAITILGVIGVISVAMFSQTLKTSTQTGNLSDLKQNGEVAMTALTESLRDAEAVVCYGPPNSARLDRLVVRTMEGKYLKFRFVDPVISSGTITRNGYIARQNNLNPARLATFCSDPPAIFQEVALTNDDPLSGVSISNGEFIGRTGNMNKDAITVKFYVNPTKSGGGTDGSSRVIMETTIQIR